MTGPIRNSGANRRGSGILRGSGTRSRSNSESASANRPNPFPFAVSSPRRASPSSITELGSAENGLTSSPILGSASSTASPNTTPTPCSSPIPVNSSFLVNKKSEWWSYYTPRNGPNGEERAYCNFCPVSYKVPCTSNMANHMREFHAAHIKPSTQSTLINLGSNVGCIKPFNNDEAREALMSMILFNNHAFSLVEEQYFLKFCAILNPLFKPVKATTLRYHIFRSYHSQKSQLVRYFSQKTTGKVSTTTDLWTSGNNFAMMAVTASWLSYDFHMNEVTVGFRQLAKEHSGVNIANTFLSILKEFHLLDLLHCVTTDNASSNGTFTAELERLTAQSTNPFLVGNWIHCMAHVLHLAVCDALAFLKPNIQKLRSLSIEIRSSPQRLALFKTALADRNFAFELGFDDDEGLVHTLIGPQDNPDPGLRVLLPLRDMPVRWGSTLSMLERGLAIRPGLDATTTLREWRTSEILEEEWELIAEAVQFLKPFATTTKFIEGFKYPTLSLVLPLYNKLLAHLKGWSTDDKHSHESRQGAEAATLKIKKYYTRLTEVYLVTTVLDCRLKLGYFEDNLRWETDAGANQDVDMIKEFVMPALQKAWAKYKDRELSELPGFSTGLPTLPTVSTVNVANSPQQSAAGAEGSNEQDFMSDIYVVRKRIRLEDELQDYLSLPRKPSNTCNFSFWRSKLNEWPRLCAMARDYLPIPASSASSERTFSAGRDMLGICRHSLYQPPWKPACVSGRCYDLNWF